MNELRNPYEPTVSSDVEQKKCIPDSRILVGYLGMGFAGMIIGFVLAPKFATLPPLNLDFPFAVIGGVLGCLFFRLVRGYGDTQQPKIG